MIAIPVMMVACCLVITPEKDEVNFGIIRIDSKDSPRATNLDAIVDRLVKGIRDAWQVADDRIGALQAKVDVAVNAIMVLVLLLTLVSVSNAIILWKMSRRE